MILYSHYCNRLLPGCPDFSALSSLVHSVPQQKWSYSENEVVSMLCLKSCCSVQSLSCDWLFATPWTAACQASLSITNSWRLLKPMSIELVMPSNHLVYCCPHLFSCLQSFPASGFFSSESVLHIRCPKYWSFSFIMSLCDEYSGLISFRIDWFYLFAVQGTLKSLLQHHSSKTSIFQCSIFFMVQLSHPYMTTGKTIAWLYRTLLAKYCLGLS